MHQLPIRLGHRACGVLAAAVLGATAINGAPAAAASDPVPAPPTTGQCRVATGFACYNVAQIRKAYNMGPLLASGLDGSGQTILIGVFNHLPTLEHDLAVFDAGMGLPPANIEYMTQSPSPTPDPTNTFDTFGALDGLSNIEWLHAMAPGAKILIAEGVSLHDIIANHLADVIAEGGGDGEQFLGRDAVMTGHQDIIDAARAHIPVISEAGETGRPDPSNLAAGPDAWYVADDPLATSVGTLELSLDAQGNRTAPDRIWNDSNRLPLPLAGGGGLSVFFDRPSYQQKVKQIVDTHRGVPDLAMAGGCDGRLIAYSSYDTVDYYVTQQPEAAGWQPFCSSSLSTTLFAGLIAIAQQAAHHHLGPLNPRLYHMTDAFTDVTVGNNAIPASVLGPADPGDPATPGYDLVSGWGSPDAYRLVSDLSE